MPIISDYEMPHVNGIAFLKALRWWGNTVPFLVFTGKGREEIVIEAFNSGADFYVQKGGAPKVQFPDLFTKSGKQSNVTGPNRHSNNPTRSSGPLLKRPPTVSW